MTQRGECIEFEVADGVVLRANFVWRDDRYAHSVTLIDPAGTHTLLESVEGSADDTWPASPPLQQLSMQGEGDQRVALLVGMAGKSHWSMSVEAAGSPRGIRFDVACRVNGPTDHLGSRYRTKGPMIVEPRAATGQLGEQRYQLCLADTSSDDGLSLSARADQILVHCLASPAAGPNRASYTARWKYVVTADARG